MQLRSIQVGVREIQVSALELSHSLELLKFCINQSTDMLSLGVENCFPFPLPQL